MVARKVSFLVVTIQSCRDNCLTLRKTLSLEKGAIIEKHEIFAPFLFKGVVVFCCKWFEICAEFGVVLVSDENAAI